MYDLYISVRTAAQKVGKSEETIKRWIRSGKIKDAYKKSDKEGWFLNQEELFTFRPPLNNMESPIGNLPSKEETTHHVQPPEDELEEMINLAYQIATLTSPSQEILHVLKSTGIKRTLELLLIMKESPTPVKNPLGFIKRAIEQGWTPTTLPTKKEKKPFIHSINPIKMARKEIVPEWLEEHKRENQQGIANNSMDEKNGEDIEKARKELERILNKYK